MPPRDRQFTPASKLLASHNRSDRGACGFVQTPIATAILAPRRAADSGRHAGISVPIGADRVSIDYASPKTSMSNFKLSIALRAGSPFARREVPLRGQLVSHAMRAPLPPGPPFLHAPQQTWRTLRGPDLSLRIGMSEARIAACRNRNLRPLLVYAVTLRRREISIRMALGSSRNAVARLTAIRSGADCRCDSRHRRIRETLVSSRCLRVL
jgi:hypothetical protein